MATILNNKKSTGGSPYGYYTVTAEASNRTTYGVTISGTITCHLASSSSSLGTGGTMGLDAYLTLNGAEQTAKRIKATDTSWSGTGNHNTNYSFTINNLQPTQTSVPISFRVARTGSASSDTSKACSLKSTTCTPLEISQGVAQSVFNSITDTTTNGKFSMSITSYQGYDVLTITNGSTFTKTIGGVANGVEYGFTAEEQTTLNGLFASNSSTISLTATLTTYTYNGGTSLGSTSKTMTLYLPDYTPTITIYRIYDIVTAYNTYKNESTDMIKGLSKPLIAVTLSSNYGNTYSSANVTCNGQEGTVSSSNITSFSLNNTADSYSISATDSRGKTGTLTLSGNSYNADIKTVQWYKGSLETTVERPSPTGSTATVTTTVNVYDGTNLKSSALLTEDFTFTYTEDGGTPQTKQKSAFTYADGKYTCTLTGLTPTKTVAWSISGTDKIGVTTNGDSDTLKIGMPVWNAYKDSSGNQTLKVNGDLKVSGSTNLNGNLDVNGFSYFHKEIKTTGQDIVLGTSHSASDDSGDLVWAYGTTGEKARLFTPTTLDNNTYRLSYRAFDKQGNNIISTDIATTNDLANLFRFARCYKTITVPSGDSSQALYPPPTISGYNFLGIMTYSQGYADQWLISYGIYGNNIVAEIRSKYPAELTTQTIVILAYIKEDYYNTLALNYDMNN